MIGIVGGVGPYAGLDLLKKVFDNTIANSDQEHIDTVLFSLASKINDRTEYLVGKVKENPAFAISEIIMQMESIGVTVAGIPCNTAHSEPIFDEITNRLRKRNSKIILLNMINETISFIKENHSGTKNIGVLSTTGTYNSKVYYNALSRHGFKVLVPSRKTQEEKIHPAIYDPVFGIKTISSPIQKKAIDNLKEGVTYLKNKGAELIILGCTEIPLAFPGSEIDGIKTVDPTTVLARALIREFDKNKLKPL